MLIYDKQSATVHRPIVLEVLNTPTQIKPEATPAVTHDVLQASPDRRNILTNSKGHAISPRAGNCPTVIGEGMI